MSSRFRAAGLLHGLAVLVLCACGGGGGGGGDDFSAPAAAPRFVVSGTIPVTAGSAIDGDVNDPTAPLSPNDSSSTAQEISNPVTLGGYANVPGAGATGRSQSAGDVLDYYRVALAQGQQVRLFLAEDGVANDLDLALLELDETPVAIRDGTERMMVIDVPAGGSYLIEISAVSGASNYVLAVGQSDAASAAAEPDFVPGELIVRFADADVERRARSLGARAVRGIPGGAALLRCDDDLERQRALGKLGMGHLLRPPDARGDPELRLRRETRLLAKAIARDRSVRAVSLNYIRTAHVAPSDERYGLQWHYPRIELPLAWENLLALDPADRAAQPVIVAVIDTGIVSSHPDLQGQIVDGYDFIQSAGAARDGDGCDPDPEDEGDGFLPSANSFHGTHVAGTIAARTSLQSGGDSKGVAGVAFDARVMPLRALGVGGGTDFDLMQAVLYAAGLDNDCGDLPARAASVINMSLGGPGFNAAFQQLIHDVRLAGVTVVASAGNGASSSPSYPAAFDGVISVSATNANDQLASYSSFGSSIDVAAPGGQLTQDLDGDGFADGVLSTWADPFGNPIYGFLQGTSMSAPHVAGVLALMLDVNPDLTPFDIDLLLEAGELTEDIGSATFFGHGRIDALAAITAALAAEGGTLPLSEPRLGASPASLDFGSLASDLLLELSNVGGSDDPLVVNDIQVSTDDGAAWLSVEDFATDADGLGSWRVRVDRSALGSEVFYTGALEIDTSHNDLVVDVLVRTQSLGPDADAGHHFVLFVDPDTLDTLGGVDADIDAGRYEFRVVGVPAGSYLIVAGTDSDNDDLICDAGEACGAYPALDELVPLVIDRDIDDADFTTGFSAAFDAEATSVGGGAGFRRPPPR